MAQNQNQGGQGQGGDTSKRGFASMDDEKQRAIAAEGGRAAHAQGTAHEFDSEEAREAGRKGGQARGSDSERDRDMQASGSSGRGGQQGQERERDEQGQFISDDESEGRGDSQGRSKQ